MHEPRPRNTSLTRRTQVVSAFRELFNARKHELAEMTTAEHGKVLRDALGDVSRGLEVVAFVCAMRHLLKGGFTQNACTKVDVVPTWFFPVAIASGNTVVFKPSEKDPAALWIAELWREAGLPDSVFNVIRWDKIQVDGLLTKPLIRAMAVSVVVAAGGIADGLVERIATRRATPLVDGRRVSSQGDLDTHDRGAARRFRTRSRSEPGPGRHQHPSHRGLDLRFPEND